MTRLSALLLLALAGCSFENPVEEPPALDRAFFVCRVQPVLVRQCAMPACHGTQERYFRLFARNRLRSSAIAHQDVADPLTEAEVQANYDAARSLTSGLGELDRGMLLKKPLEQRAGGYYHGATTKLGHRSDNVFASQADPEYQVLLDWVRGATEAADCLDPGAAP